MEWPECPVCLQNYDGAASIPRVLGCGHTACEACLSKLPERFPLTVRCPACTQLVKFPSQGPSSLPKNIDLLSLSDSNPNPSPTVSLPTAANRRCLDFLFPRLWSDEFYSAWNRRVLSADAVSMDDRKVSLVSLSRLGDSGCEGFEFSYVVRVMNCLSEMRERARDELDLILGGSSRGPRRKTMGRVCGIWGDLKNDGFLYLVCERLGESGLGKIGGDLRDEFNVFVTVSVEVIEAVIGLHLEGFVAGFVAPSCFSFDEFGRVCVEVGELLVTGRKVRESIGSGGVSNLLIEGVFISPEVLEELLCKESRYPVGCNSDTWAVACLLLRLLVGEFIEEFPTPVDVNGCDYSVLYSTWLERVHSVLDTQLGMEYASVKDVILKCLSYDPECRPLLSEVRKALRQLIIKPQFDLASLELAIDDSKCSVILLGELCNLAEELLEEKKEVDSEGRESGSEIDSGQVKAIRVDKNFVDGLSEGVVKFKDLQGHRDCITGIVVGGGFIFSSSFDRTIRVWSLQDFTHVHTFEGHEHKVMAIVYIDQEQPLCISGDSGGGIYVWGLCTPFGNKPLQKWYEPKDWRYSGIHALCFSKNGFIYTGSGDKSIKAWMLKDGHLACTMNGHRSVVSTLAICDEVLYSGSWDGTVRLWSLSDHTPLTVIGEDASGAVISVLSLAVDRHMLIAAYENGCVKVWRNEVFMRSLQLHEGAIFATALNEGKWFFSGGWDKTVNVQELCGDVVHVDPRPIGTMPCSSAITVLLYRQGKLFVGCADRLVKVFYSE